MKKFFKYLLSLGLLLSVQAKADLANVSGGFNLTETDEFHYDASVDGTKTPAQVAVDHIKRLGGKHVELNVRARMITGTGTEIVPVTKPADRADEAKRMIRLMKYIKEQGMTVGIRPIFFVVGPNGEFPYYQIMPDGHRKHWWHGNIQPVDPDRWFDSFRTYLDVYITIANIGKADEFTIGAELYSMTVGIEDQWEEYQYGFPGRWLALLRYVKMKLPRAMLMYDINFTDDSNASGGFQKSGGELERWRYRLVDLANPTDPEELKIWQDLVQFWRELDGIGIDMYRSLASRGQVPPTNYNDLVKLLRQRADSYASQLDTAWTEISLVTEIEKKLYFKEIGYRSVQNGFIDPFTFADNDPRVNIMHQAAAYDAFFGAFWDAKWPWLGGVFFWDVSVDPSKHTGKDSGFSPVNKKQTEEVILRRFL